MHEEYTRAPLVSASFRDLAFIFFKWKWQVLLIVVLTVLVAGAYVGLVRDTAYETSAKLLVRFGQEQAPPTTMLGNQSVLLTQRPQDVNSEIDILRSTDLLARVVDQLNLDAPEAAEPVPERFLPRVKYRVKEWLGRLKESYHEFMVRLGVRPQLSRREQAILNLQQSLSVETLPQSNVIMAKLIVPQREGAADILNALVKRYLDFRVSVFSDRNSVAYFREQLNDAQSRLEEAEERLARFEQRHDIQSLNEQEGLLLGQLADVRTRLNQAKLALRQAELKVERFDQRVDGNKPDFSSLGDFEDESFPESIMLELAELTKQREELRLQAAESSARVQNIDNQQTLLLAMLERNLSAVAEERRAKVDALAVERAALETKLRRLQAAEKEWTQLRRSVKVAEDSYLFFQDKLEEASAVAAMKNQEIGNVSVIQQAMTPMQPVGVSKSVLIVIATVLGIFAALSWAAIREFFDHWVYSADQLRRHLGVPVMAVIPEWKPRHAKQRS